MEPRPDRLTSSFSRGAKMSLKEIFGKAGTVACENDRLRFTLGIVDPTVLVQHIEQIPIHPLPGSDDMMIAERGEPKNGQRSFAQFLLIEIQR